MLISKQLTFYPPKSDENRRTFYTIGIYRIYVINTFNIFFGLLIIVETEANRIFW